MKKFWLWFLLLGGAAFVVLGMAVFALFGSPSIPLGGDLALIEIEGPLYEAQPILKQFAKVYDRDDLKAVVIRVNSPGGTVAASQEIHDAVSRLREKSKKVVISMGTVAASGGYYLAAPADWIVANPGTITGSIGVRLEYLNVEDILKWVRLKRETLKSGTYKDIGSPIRPMTPEEKGMLEAILKDMHAQFKEAVAAGRGLSAEEVEAIADGRVFTGREALRKKLVDQLGSLEAAYKKAGELAGIKGEPKVVTVPKEKEGLLDYLLGDASSGLRQVLNRSLLQASAGGVLPVYQW
ncbi:MAG: signal peptide peptidase SppA [Deltaproteobacteria bacterium]|nr:signal peptide peptidase SppA [Deltaproteobacteria bacterium]